MAQLRQPCHSFQVRCLSILPLAIELYGYHIAACIGRQGKSGRENIWRSLPVCLWEDSGMRVAASSGSLAMGGLSAACGDIPAPGVAPSPSPSDLTLRYKETQFFRSVTVVFLSRTQ